MSNDYNISIQQPNISAPIEEKQQQPSLAVKGQSNETTDKVKKQEVLTRSTSSQMQGLGKSYPSSPQMQLQFNNISKVLVQMIKFLNRDKPLIQTTGALIAGKKESKNDGKHLITLIISKKLSIGNQIEQARKGFTSDGLKNGFHTRMKGLPVLKQIFSSIFKKNELISTSKEIFKLTVETNATKKQIKQVTKDLNELKNQKKDWQASIRLLGEASPEQLKGINDVMSQIKDKQGELDKLNSELNLSVAKLNIIKNTGMFGRISNIDINHSLNGVLQRINGAAIGMIKILTPTDKKQAFVANIPEKVEQAISKNQKIIDEKKVIIDELKQNNKKIEKTDENGNTTICWEKNHQLISDLETEIKNLGKKIDKFKAIQKKVQESPEEVRKQISPIRKVMGEIKPGMKEVFEVARTSTKENIDPLKAIASQINGPKEAKEKFYQEVDSFYKESLSGIALAENNFNEELENPSLTILFSIWDNEKLTFGEPVNYKLVGAFAGDMKSTKLSEVYKSFDKTFIRGQLLKGVYGAKDGLPPFPMGTFQAEDLSKIQNYFNNKAKPPELAEKLTEAYVELREANVVLETNPKRYLRAAENFVQLYNSMS